MMIGPESPTWFKSSHSGSNGGDCVEVAFTGPAVGVRDTKDRTAGHLTVSGPAWDGLLVHARSRNPRTAPRT
jgi:hypothetical protein